MKISASIQSSLNEHRTLVQTDGASKEIQIPVKASGLGSSINGAELLMLSLATCFCNDIYREAGKRKMNITSVDVEVTGEFGAEGEPGSNFQYKTRIISDSTDEEINDLISYTDKVAEVHNTLRKGLNITLVK